MVGVVCGGVAANVEKMDWVERGRNMAEPSGGEAKKGGILMVL